MADRRPRILYICPTWPGGLAHGGQQRALYIGRALREIGDVTLLVVSDDIETEAAREITAREFHVVPQIRPHPAPRRRIGAKLRRVVDSHNLDVHGIVACEPDRQRVLHYISEHDLVWVMNARIPSLLQIWRWPHTHLDVDNIPSAQLRAASGAATGWMSQLKTQAQWLFQLRRERHYCERFTSLSVCSEADRIDLGHNGVHVIPNGFARPTMTPVRTLSCQTPRIGFIGLYSYAPNLDGVQWFLEHAWPAVERAVPRVRFRLIGTDTDGPLRPSGTAVDALGWMADPAAEIGTWSAMVVPIRFGGGTRIKLVDAFSRQCPVVSTRFGAHGYRVESNKQLLLADDGPDFALACIDLLRDPAHGRRLAASAWDDFLRHWSWEAIGPRIADAAAACLDQNPNLIPEHA